MFSESNNPILTDETRNPIQLWTKLRANQHALLDNHQHILNLVDLVESLQMEWRKSATENAQYRESNDRLKRENGNYERQLTEANEEINFLHSQRAADQTLIQNLQLELEQYKERFNLAKTTMQNATIVLPSIRETAYTNSDTETVSTGSRQVAKRRSNSLGVLPDKRMKRYIQDEDNLERLKEEDMTDDDDLPPRQQPLMRRQRTMNRSISESRIFDNKEKQQEPKPIAGKCTTTSTLNIHHSPMVGYGCGWTRGRPVDECEHSFAAHNNLFSALSYCCVCVRSLGMRSLKCNGCKMLLHENCRQNAPIPCVPMISTPQRNNPKQRPRLGDLCPDVPPKIPGQIIRCVVALERGFITNVGLYRVPGCDSEVRRLKENFASKFAPKLDQLDPETITGYIKKFLRDLREPVIPFSSFKEFCTAVARKDEDLLKYAIETLPIPNRDTLAYLCAHWQKVALRSNENQMPIENLARVLGPTVVGTSSKLTHLTYSPRGGIPAGQSSNGGDPQRHFMEAGKQVEILLALLKLDHDYWTSFYNSPAGLVGGGNGTPKMNFR